MAEFAALVARLVATQQPLQKNLLRIGTNDTTENRIFFRDYSVVIPV